MVVHEIETGKTARARSDPSPGERNPPPQSSTAIPSPSECACAGTGWIMRDGKAFRCACAIDRRLAADPVGHAIPVSEGLYAFEVHPLRVQFEINTNEHVVTVVSVRELP